MSLLLLESRDLENTSAATWLASAPRALIISGAADGSIPVGTGSLITHPGEWIAFTSDSQRMWVEQSQPDYGK